MKCKLILLVGALVLAGCFSSDPTSPNLAGESPYATQSTPGEMVPFKVHWQGTFRVLSITPEVGSFEFDAIGNATHMGLSFLFAPLSEVQLATGAQTAAGTITAANGDQLNWELEGTAIPNAEGDFQLDGEYTITGGTGRFSGATGGGTYTGTAGPAGAPEGTNDWIMTGTISRPGGADEGNDEGNLD